MKYAHVPQESSHGNVNSAAVDELEEPAQLRQDVLHDNVDADWRMDYFKDVLELLQLTMPIAISRLAWVGMKTTDTALIGHTGTRYLSASAVSDLWMQSTGVFLSGGVLSMFASQAVGSENKKMAGVWTQVSMFVLALLAVPVIISYFCTGPLLSAIGTDRSLLEPAAYYAFVMAAAVPARIMTSQISQYFFAQKITSPLVVCGFLALSLNLLFGYLFVLGVPSSASARNPYSGWVGWGFWACPVVTTIVEWFQLLFLLFKYCYMQGLHKECWPVDGFSWRHVTKERVVEFCKMYFPAALSGASDWWRVSAIGVVAVSFGDHASLAVFNSSYRILWMCLIFIGSIGSALGVKVGNALGAGDATTAKRHCLVALSVVVGSLAVFTLVVYSIPGKIAMLFSSDPAVLALYSDVALPLAATLFFMNLSVFLERIQLSCGRTQLVFWAGVVGSWAGQVPGVLLCTQLWRNDLYGLFCGVAGGYALLDIILICAVVRYTNFEKYAVEAVARSSESTRTSQSAASTSIAMVDKSQFHSQSQALRARPDVDDDDDDDSSSEP